MPAYRLANARVSVDALDVVGEDSRSVLHFVCHVGLAVEARKDLACGDQVAVRHMGPPLENPGAMAAHAVGSAVLSVDEASQIQLYLDEIEAEYNAAPQRPNRHQQYVVHPHVKPWRAKDGTVLWLRFSCAGLVIESYRDAGIDLIAEESLEPVDADVLDNAYPDLAPVRNIPSRLRESLGIPGEGPWPVLLAGHVLHALNRTPEDIRRVIYRPSSADAAFP